MSKARYTPEFKQSAAGLVSDQSYTYTEACQSLNVGSSALRHWVTQLQQKRQGMTSKGYAITADQQARSILRWSGVWLLVWS